MFIDIWNYHPEYVNFILNEKWLDQTVEDERREEESK
jgi:hypothetical protein